MEEVGDSFLALGPILIIIVFAFGVEETLIENDTSGFLEG